MQTATSHTVIVSSVAFVLSASGFAQGQTTTLFTVAPGGPSTLGSELIFSPGPVLEAGGPGEKVSSLPRGHGWVP